MYCSISNVDTTEKEEPIAIQDITNTKQFPTFDPIRLENIFLLDDITEEVREKEFSHYNYRGIPIPRVTAILQSQIYKEGLIYWALNITKDEYKKKITKAKTVGSYTHEMIENFLLNRTDLELGFNVSLAYQKEISTAYMNFKLWLDYLERNGYYIEEIVAIEYPVLCPYYGGTVDCIVKINGAYYIIDFKTSKKISYEYLLQACSYMWIVNNGYIQNLPHINGIGIIRIDKEIIGKFEDIFLNETIPYQREIIQNCYNCFASLLAAYYQNINMNEVFKRYKKQYHLKEALL